MTAAFFALAGALLGVAGTLLTTLIGARRPTSTSSPPAASPCRGGRRAPDYSQATPSLSRSSLRL